MNKIIWIVIVFLILFISCDKTEQPVAVVKEDDVKNNSYIIGISPLTLQLGYYVSYIQSIRENAIKKDIDLIIADSMWNTSKQISDIKYFIEKGVDAIICSPTDPEAVKAVLLEAEENGIPVIIEMTAIAGMGPLVATDQRKGGEIAGRFAGEWINNRYGGVCKVAILDFPYFKNIDDRVQGFISGLYEVAPEVEIAAVVDAKAKYETSAQVMYNLLVEYPDIRCVFGINDDSAKGANSVFEEGGYPSDDVCIIGFDADEGARKLIRTGKCFKASIAADTEKIAECCIETALKRIAGEDVGEWVEVKNAQYLITIDNVNEFMEK